MIRGSLDSTVTCSPAGLMSSCDHSHTAMQHSGIRISSCHGNNIGRHASRTVMCEQVVHSLSNGRGAKAKTGRRSRLLLSNRSAFEGADTKGIWLMMPDISLSCTVGVFLQCMPKVMRWCRCLTESISLSLTLLYYVCVACARLAISQLGMIHESTLHASGRPLLVAIQPYNKVLNTASKAIRHTLDATLHGQNSPL